MRSVIGEPHPGRLVSGPENHVGHRPKRFDLRGSQRTSSPSLTVSVKRLFFFFFFFLFLLTFNHIFIFKFNRAPHWAPVAAPRRLSAQVDVNLLEKSAAALRRRRIGMNARPVNIADPCPANFFISFRAGGFPGAVHDLH